MEPSQADINAVAQAIGEPAQVQPTPAPVAQPVATPAPEATPAPVTPPADPFASLFATPTPAEPAQPVTPAEPVQPQLQQPTEPTPTPQPQQPVEPAQPVQAQTPAPQTEQYQTYDEYMNSVMQGVPQVPDMPDPDSIDANDPQAIKSFFDEIVNTAVTRAEANLTRKAAIEQTERRLWDSAFEKYGSLKSNQQLRDMVHDIRMGYFRRGIAISPTQAADKLLESLGDQYKKGVTDTSVITTIENVQPVSGNTGAEVPTGLDTGSNLEALQTGGEEALIALLDSRIKEGKM